MSYIPFMNFFTEIPKNSHKVIVLSLRPYKKIVVFPVACQIKIG